jgi:hypothetical protein
VCIYITAAHACMRLSLQTWFGSYLMYWHVCKLCTVTIYACTQLSHAVNTGYLCFDILRLSIARRSVSEGSGLSCHYGMFIHWYLFWFFVFVYLFEIRLVKFMCLCGWTAAVCCWVLRQLSAMHLSLICLTETFIVPFSHVYDTVCIYRPK